MDPRYWGGFCLLLISAALLAGISGCSTTEPPGNSFKAVCALVPIGRTEEGVAVVKTYCEVE